MCEKWTLNNYTRVITHKKNASEVVRDNSFVEGEIYDAPWNVEGKIHDVPWTYRQFMFLYLDTVVCTPES